MAFTLAEINAEITRLKLAYDATNELESSSVGQRQANHRKMEEIRNEITWWIAERNRARNGGIRNRGAVPW